MARSQRSLSVAQKIQQRCGKEDENIPDTCCAHKSHCRLEALRTLNLANNQLQTLELFLPRNVDDNRTQRNGTGLGSDLGIFFAKQQDSEGSDYDDSGFNWKKGNEQVEKRAGNTMIHPL